jgi:hypothetical protein
MQTISAFLSYCFLCFSILTLLEFGLSMSSYCCRDLMLWMNHSLVMEEMWRKIRRCITIKVFIFEFAKHLHVCIMSDCSYADSLTLSAAPENITLFEPFQADAVPYNRFERFLLPPPFCKIVFSF